MVYDGVYARCVVMRGCVTSRLVASRHDTTPVCRRLGRRRCVGSAGASLGPRRRGETPAGSPVVGKRGERGERGARGELQGVRRCWRGVGEGGEHPLDHLRCERGERGGWRVTGGLRRVRGVRGVTGVVGEWVTGGEHPLDHLMLSREG